LRLPEGRILLSVNPATSRRDTLPDGRKTYFCEPRLLEFSAAKPEKPPIVLKPRWDSEYEFTDHSYRGAAADRATGEILLLNICPEGYAMSLLDRDGQWHGLGLLRFPIRGCYPNVALRDRAAYVMAVSDIPEPVEEWRAFKRKVTGREWDFDFRQIFFTYTPDITKKEFSPILTVASRDETAGFLWNRDMWIDARGDVHLIITERSVWHRFMRDRFFPGLPITVALKYCRIREGTVVERRTLAQCSEDMNETRKKYGATSADNSTAFAAIGPVVSDAAFHATADGRLFVIYGAVEEDSPANYLLQLVPRLDEAPVKLDLEYPLKTFFTASERMGTEPSDVIDMYGLAGDPNTIRYAQIALP
jgi:hypothetical protein